MAKSRSSSPRAALPLARYVRLYEAQLRAERKSPKTITVYGAALGRFSRWFEREHGEPPSLSDFSKDNVRLFLGDLSTHVTWEDHPLLNGRHQGPCQAARCTR
jgi:hypothetical protein